MPGFESSSPTVTGSCQVRLKGTDNMTKARPCSSGCRGSRELGSWLERSEPTPRERPAWIQPRLSILLGKISTVQLSHALSCQPWGSWKIPDSKRTHWPSLEGSKMSKFVTFNWPWVKISNCRPSKVPVTRNLAKVMYVRELEADRNSFKYKLTDKILFHNGFLFLNIYVISR